MRGSEGQIVGLLGGEFTETIKGARFLVDFAHGFEQQILQGGMKIVSHEQSVADGKQINGVTRLKRGDQVQFGQTVAEVVK